MKRKLYELKNSRALALKAAEQALAGGDNAAYEAKMAEVEAANKQIENVEKLLSEQGRYTTEPGVPGAEPAKKSGSGFTALLKMLRGQNLAEDESQLMRKALISGTDAASGENYLIPEDVKTEIREMRKSYVSAKELVNVIPVDTLSGSTVFESGTPTGLTDFDDGDVIATETDPAFVQKKWTIGWRGKLIPISRILGNAVAGLKAYLNRWFVRSAIITENQKIFAAFKTGYNSGTPKAVAGWEALKASIAEDLDPSCLIDGVIATNQSGFACLDAEKDGNGRPILQPDPSEPTRKLFQGLPIKVYPNAQLPNIDGTHFPIIYGCTKAGVDFMEYQDLLIETSEHYLFNKNQNCMRVIEGFDIVSADTSAYIYGSLTATPTPAANTPEG